MAKTPSAIPSAPLKDVPGHPLLTMLGGPDVEKGKQVQRASDLPDWLHHWDRGHTGVIPREATVDAVRDWISVFASVLEELEKDETKTYHLTDTPDAGTDCVRNAYRLIRAMEASAVDGLPQEPDRDFSTHQAFLELRKLQKALERIARSKAPDLTLQRSPEIDDAMRPEWFGDVYRRLHGLLRTNAGARDRFCEMILKFAAREQADFNRLEEWKDDRNQHFVDNLVFIADRMKRGNSGLDSLIWQSRNDPRFSDLLEGMYWDSDHVSTRDPDVFDALEELFHAGIIDDAQYEHIFEEGGYVCIWAWTPEEYAVCNESEEDSLIPLPQRDLKLDEKYVVLAAIFNDRCSGVDPIQPWAETSPGFVYFHLECERIRELTADDEVAVLGFLDDVNDDLKEVASNGAQTIPCDDRALLGEVDADAKQFVAPGQSGRSPTPNPENAVPPDGFRGPLIGSQKQLAKWTTGKEDHRGLWADLKSGQLWMKKTAHRYRCELWFATQEEYAAANSTRIAE